MIVPLPLQDKGRSSGTEMPHVQAFDANPGPAGEPLMDVPEDRVPRPGDLNRLEQSHAALLQPPGHGVIQEFRNGGWNVGAQHVDFADRLDLARYSPRSSRWRPVGRFQPAADEPEPPPVQVDRAAVQDVVPGLGTAATSGGRRRCRRSGRRAAEGPEQLRVLPGHGALEQAGRALAPWASRRADSSLASSNFPRCAARRRPGPPRRRTGRRRCPARSRRSPGTAAGRPGRSVRQPRARRSPGRPPDRARRSPRELACHHGKARPGRVHQRGNIHAAP